MAKATMTIGELRKELAGWPDDYEVQFSGGLNFYRLKQRGESLVQIEFSENVWQDREGGWHVDSAAGFSDPTPTTVTIW